MPNVARSVIIFGHTKQLVEVTQPGFGLEVRVGLGFVRVRINTPIHILVEMLEVLFCFFNATLIKDASFSGD